MLINNNKNNDKYFGLPFDFKLTDNQGKIIFINGQCDLHHLAHANLVECKLQQFTGILDRNKNKIYFGDTLRFADKFEWYRNKYWSKVHFGIISKKDALAAIDASPYEERLIENHQDFDWLLSGEIQNYWEIVPIS